MIYNNKFKDLEKEAVLWRYMDISKFISLVSTGCIWLARSDTFKDQSEGKFHLEMKKTLSEAYSKFELKDDDLIKDENDFQEYLIKNAYISCWHENNHENMVMWEIYSKTQDSIAIKTTAEKLIRSINFNKLKFSDYKLDRVDYMPNVEIVGKLKYSSPFFIKRPHFAHESEVRLFFSSYSSYAPTIDTPIGCAIPIDLSTLIEEIIIHPDAQEWFMKTIQSLKRVYKLNAPVRKGVCGNSI
jgi:hypothetical protein